MEGFQPGEPVLEATLRLLTRDGPAATVAACLLLKAAFLGLHLLALGPPECSGMEKLALLHWSFDVWNVWCLAVFVRTGRLPWSLETCVLYHVLGYLVYSLVYLHLHTRESRGGAFSRMSGTPDSEVTVRVSEEEEELGVPVGDPFLTPGRAGVLSEDVPDEEPAAEDKEDGGEDREQPQPQTPATGKSGRDALCAFPEDKPPPADDPSAMPGGPSTGEEPKDQEEPQHTPAAPGGEDGERPDQPQASPVGVRTYRKLDAAASLSKSPVKTAEEGGYRDITEDVAAVLKAGRQRDVTPGGPQDTDGTGFNKQSPVKADRGKTADPSKVVTVPLDLNGKEEHSTDGGRTAELEGVKADEDGGKVQNGDHGGLNGDHDAVAGGDAKEHNGGDMNGGDEGKTDGHHSEDHH